MTVNHDVAGSSPAGGATQKTTQKGGLFACFFAVHEPTILNTKTAAYAALTKGNRARPLPVAEEGRAQSCAAVDEKSQSKKFYSKYKKFYFRVLVKSDK